MKKQTKWHYFNCTDDLCFYKDFKGNKTYHTACSRNIHKLKKIRHTELKSQVTCLKCLSTLNKIEGEKK